MVDEIEVDLERARAVRNRRGRQAARGDVKHDVPGVIEPWGARGADLADDLGPQMQGRVGFAPLGGGQFRPRYLRCWHLRPWHSRGVAHLSPQKTVIGIPSHDKGRARTGPALIGELKAIGDGCDGYFFAPLAKAASTSSSLIRAAGFPR